MESQDAEVLYESFAYSSEQNIVCYQHLWLVVDEV
jgi:hypothetical protein